MKQRIFPSTHFESISTGAQLIVFSLRQWRGNIGDSEQLRLILEPFFIKLNVAPALDPVMELLCELDLDADEPFVSNCLCSRFLSESELAFLTWLDACKETADLLPAFMRASNTRESVAQKLTVIEALEVAGLAVNPPSPRPFELAEI
jgi:hypothetical protein